jgi:hypothetical protein
MSNHELLLYFGFSIDKNPKGKSIASNSIEYIPITLDLEIPQEKLKLLDQLDLSLNHFLKFNIFPTKLLNTLKICFATEEELKSFKKFHDFSLLKENNQDCFDSIVELISSMKEMLQIEKEEKNLKFKQYSIYRMNLIDILESNLKFFQ